MAARALLYIGETSNKCIFTTVQYPNTRTQLQGSWRQARGFKRHRDTTKQAESAFSDVALSTGTLSSRKLWKSLGFTIAFGGSTLLAASICEYERIRRHTHWVINQYHSATQWRVNRSGWRGEAEKLWRSLTDGQRVFAPICFLNILVFCGWRVPALKNTMLRYFCANPSSSAMCWPMLLSTFSHYSVLHLAANMYVLHSFSTAAVACLGREQFVAFYLTSGVVSSFASHFYKTAFSMPGISLGAYLKKSCCSSCVTNLSSITKMLLALSAFQFSSFWTILSVLMPINGFAKIKTLYLNSGINNQADIWCTGRVTTLLSVNKFTTGLNYLFRIVKTGFLTKSGAIMGIVIFVCSQYPDTRLSIAFLPMWTFAASSAIKAILAVDTLGCVLGWRFMDHAAHLGGALYGIFWQYWGSANIWQKREPIVKYWHSIRHPPRSSN